MNSLFGMGTYERAAPNQEIGAAQNLGQRLREWRKTTHLKSYELAKVIQISQGSLSDIENDKSLPSADTLAKLYQLTNINIIWLLTGKGNMHRNKTPDSSEICPDNPVLNSANGKDQALKDLLERVIRVYQRADAGKRAHLEGFLAGADPGE